ncbi:MAG: hypothetical protein K2Y37_27090 [Pirellulales bacterium]|nr:hypothetical protein [Pirellulales bacterium]
MLDTYRVALELNGDSPRITKVRSLELKEGMNPVRCQEHPKPLKAEVMDIGEAGVFSANAALPGNGYAVLLDQLLIDPQRVFTLGYDAARVEPVAMGQKIAGQYLHKTLD